MEQDRPQNMDGKELEKKHKISATDSKNCNNAWGCDYYPNHACNVVAHN